MVNLQVQDLQKNPNTKTQTSNTVLPQPTKPIANIKIIAEKNGQYTYQIEPNIPNVKFLATQPQHSILNQDGARKLTLSKGETADFIMEVNGKIIQNKRFRIKGGQIYEAPQKQEANKEATNTSAQSQTKPIAITAQAQTPESTQARQQVTTPAKPVVPPQAQATQPVRQTVVTPVPQTQGTHILRQPATPTTVIVTPRPQPTQQPISQQKQEIQPDAKTFFTNKGYTEIVSYLNKNPNLKVDIKDGNILVRKDGVCHQPFSGNISESEILNKLQNINGENRANFLFKPTSLTRTTSIPLVSQTIQQATETSDITPEQIQGLIRAARERLANGRERYVTSLEEYNKLCKEAVELGVPAIAKIGYPGCPPCRAYSNDLGNGVAAENKGKVLFISIDISDPRVEPKFRDICNEIARNQGGYPTISGAGGWRPAGYLGMSSVMQSIGKLSDDSKIAPETIQRLQQQRKEGKL